MISSGLLISVIGITMVFLIFFVLIIAMNATAAIVRILNKKFPEPEAVKVESGAANRVRDTSSEEEEIALAIAAAHHFAISGSTAKQ
jgi:sodium pump decarboxylase gamma subunit